MSIHHLADHEFRRAQARVPEFFRKAEALLAAGFDEELHVISALGANTLDHLRVEHLDAVRIYPAPGGGYHADLIFALTPSGIGNTVGTPASCPEPTRAAADDRAVRLLAMLLHRQGQRPPRPRTLEQAIFSFHGWDFRVRMQDVVSEVCACDPELEMTIRDSLDAFVADRLEGGVTAAALDRLPLEHWEKLYQLMCRALGARIIRHPASATQAPRRSRPNGRS